MPVGNITLRADGAIAATTASATLTVTAPAMQENDLLLAYIMSNDNLTWTAPAGWTMIGTSTNTANLRCALFWKAGKAADSGATFDFVKSANNGLVSAGAITAWINARMDAPIDGVGVFFSANASADSVTFTNFTQKTTQCRIIWVSFYNDDQTTFNTPTGVTVDGGPFVGLDVETATGAGASISDFYARKLSPVAVGAGSVASASVVDAISIGAVFALAEGMPETGGGTGGAYGLYTGPGGRGRSQGPRVQKDLNGN